MTDPHAEARRIAEVLALLDRQTMTWQDTQARLRNVGDAYRELARAYLDLSAREEQQRHDLDAIHTALAEASVPRSDGIDEPLYSDAYRVRLLSAREERLREDSVLLAFARAYMAALGTHEQRLAAARQAYEAALATPEADDGHAYAEHLREAREVEAWQEAKHARREEDETL